MLKPLTCFITVTPCKSIPHVYQFPMYIDLSDNIIRLFQLSVDELFFPHVKFEKPGRRKWTEAMMDRLDDTELLVIEGTIKGILRMKEEKDKK